MDDSTGTAPERGAGSASPSPAIDPERYKGVPSSALKALAHPLRVEIIDALGSFGPATASALGERLNESSGATSYHLRQLAKHGFIVEDEARGTARERWWRLKPGGMTVDPSQYEGDRAAEAASMLVARQVLEQRYRHADAFLRAIERGEVVPEAGVALSTARLRCTDAEREELIGQVQSVIDAAVDRFADRRDDESVPLAEIQFAAFPILDPLAGPSVAQEQA